MLKAIEVTSSLTYNKINDIISAKEAIFDLANFMQRNFMFNMSFEKLGYLTGRSLSTFNRDFKKLFNTTPQKALTDKRLKLAYYHLAEKKKKAYGGSS